MQVSLFRALKSINVEDEVAEQAVKVIEEHIEMVVAQAVKPLENKIDTLIAKIDVLGTKIETVNTGTQTAVTNLGRDVTSMRWLSSVSAGIASAVGAAAAVGGHLHF